VALWLLLVLLAVGHCMVGRDIFQSLIAAREGAYFKREQEAAAWELRKRLIKEGRYEPTAFTSDASNVEAASEVLSEILQQGSRITSKEARLAAEVVRLGKSLPPGWREAELRDAAHRNRPPELSDNFMNAVGARGMTDVPRVDFEELRREALAQHLALAPEKREAMARVYFAGARALLYGTALAALGVGVIVGAGVRIMHQNRAQTNNSSSNNTTTVT